jgi:hypothetical protein
VYKVDRSRRKRQVPAASRKGTARDTQVKHVMGRKAQVRKWCRTLLETYVNGSCGSLRKGSSGVVLVTTPENLEAASVQRGCKMKSSWK